MTGAFAGAGVGLGAWLCLLGLRGRKVLPDLSQLMGAGIDAATATAWLTAAAAAAIVTFAITGWIVVAFTAAIAVAARPRSQSARRRERSEVDRLDAVATWTEMIRDNIAGAAGLEQAIAATTARAPDAIEPELRALATRLEAMPLTDALACFGDDLDLPPADLVVAALVNATRTPSGDLGSLLSRLADSVRADVRMRGRIEVGRARIRTSARMVVGVTAATIAFLLLTSRDLLAVYDGTSGQLLLCVVAATFMVGAATLRAYAVIDAPQRFTARRLPASMTEVRS